ncbi:MAG: hypothetical protein SWZ49_01925 [Cyanobacteriota bacterium]|nr:hypothetical protein [Cyanobacteriota bacterium]
MGETPFLHAASPDFLLFNIHDFLDALSMATNTYGYASLTFSNNITPSLTNTGNG